MMFFHPKKKVPLFRNLDTVFTRCSTSSDIASAFESCPKCFSLEDGVPVPFQLWPLRFHLKNFRKGIWKYLWKYRYDDFAAKFCFSCIHRYGRWMWLFLSNSVRHCQSNWFSFFILLNQDGNMSRFFDFHEWFMIILKLILLLFLSNMLLSAASSSLVLTKTYSTSSMTWEENTQCKTTSRCTFFSRLDTQNQWLVSKSRFVTSRICRNFLLVRHVPSCKLANGSVDISCRLLFKRCFSYLRPSRLQKYHESNFPAFLPKFRR